MGHPAADGAVRTTHCCERPPARLCKRSSKELTRLRSARRPAAPASQPRPSYSSSSSDASSSSSESRSAAGRLPGHGLTADAGCTSARLVPGERTVAARAGPPGPGAAATAGHAGRSVSLVALREQDQPGMGFRFLGARVPYLAGLRWSRKRASERTGAVLDRRQALPRGLGAGARAAGRSTRNSTAVGWALGSAAVPADAQ
jgi:hypothetical protein